MNIIILVTLFGFILTYVCLFLFAKSSDNIYGKYLAWVSIFMLTLLIFITIGLISMFLFGIIEVSDINDSLLNKIKYTVDV